MADKFYLLKNSSFRNLYIAGFISELGSFATDTALMLLIYKLSSENQVYLGLHRAIFLTFLTLGGILGGPIGEKFNRKQVLILSNIFRIPLILGILFFPKLWPVILLSGLIAFFTGIFNPSRQTLINEVVPKKEMPYANSLIGSTMAILHLAAPLIGAILYSYFHGVNEILIFDFLTYIVGIFLISKISYRSTKKNSTKDNSLSSSFKEGITYIKNRPDLLGLFSNTFTLGLAIGILLPLILPFIKETYNYGEKEYGILMACFGSGGILGGFAFSYLSKHFSTGRIIVVLTCVESFFMILWPQLNIFAMNLIIFLLWGILVFTRVSAHLNYLSETVEVDYLSRVHAILDMSFVIPNILGGLVISLIGKSFSSHNILLWTGISFLILMSVRLPSKSIKSLFFSKRTTLS